MKYSAQTYLSCYQNLHSAQASKQANKTLLEIEQSPDAWQIASQLMLIQQYNIHGSQLLSKKLNCSLPSEVNPQTLAQFILTQKHISNIHWLCLAKVFIHTHQIITDLIITGSLEIDFKLNILKEIPYALGQMKLDFLFKSNDYRNEVYKQNKFLILEAIALVESNRENFSSQMQKIQDLVFETLQSFTQHKIPLNSHEIAQFTLQCADSDKTAIILEYIFLQEKYPELEQKFENYLQTNIFNQEKDWIKTFYFNFYAKKNIYETFSLQKFKKVLSKVNKIMKVEDDEQYRTILTDSYQFWLSLINKLPIKTQILEEFTAKKQLLKQSIFGVYQTILLHSKLKKCPTTIKIIESTLDIIDLDSEEGFGQPQNLMNNEFDQLNYNIRQVRDLAIDLMVKIEEGLKQHPDLYKKMFQTLYILASNSQDIQDLELAIFIVDGMTDFCDQKSKPYLSQLIKVILSQKEKLNQYICQRIVIMLGKIDKIIVSNISMLHLVFEFFSNTIMYEKLSALASQSFTDLISQYEATNFHADNQFKEKSQNYLNFWFDNFYKNLKNEKVLQNITKALVIFIYKFKGPEYYNKFLYMMQAKIYESTDQMLKNIYLQAVITSQNWINSREQNIDQYLLTFGNFMNNFRQNLQENCFKVNRKPQFTKQISKLNWALKSGCYFTNIQEWISTIKNIIKKALLQNPTQILSVSLTPLISLLKSQRLKQEHLKTLCQSIGQILDPITQLYIKSHENKTTLDYNFSKYVIQIHNLVISIILGNQKWTEISLINYNPSPLFSFIRQKIFMNKTFWEYEVYKESLIFMNFLVLSNYEIETICSQILGICGKTSQSLWIQTENVFLNIFKNSGTGPFIKALKVIKPQILPPNPLFGVFEQALKKSDRKALKSFVRCL